MTTPAPAEFLYELWDANWDDGPLGNYQLRRHPITKKTCKRIYFTYLNRRRTGYVDRQQIETDGETYHRSSGRLLHLAPPKIPGSPNSSPSLPELRKAMADAHPDRGTNEAFITAHARYEGALAQTKAPNP